MHERTQTRGPIFIMDGVLFTLFDIFWTVKKKKTPAYSHSKAWKTKDNF